MRKKFALVRRGIDERRVKERARLQRAFSGNGRGGGVDVLQQGGGGEEKGGGEEGEGLTGEGGSQGQEE